MKKLFNVFLSISISILIVICAFGCGKDNSVKKGIYLNKEEIVFEEVGEKQTVVLKNGDKDIKAGISWISLNPEIATVSGGEITAVSAGETKIIARYDDIDYEVKVISNIKEIRLNKKNLVLKNLREKEQLFLKKGDENILTGVEWTSDNIDIATVEDGLVKAKNKGSATIIAKYEGIEYKCVVLVESEFSISISNKEVREKTFSTESDYRVFKILELNSKDEIRITYNYIKELPKDSDEVYFTIKDEDIASIDNNGNLKAKKDGITVLKIETKEKKPTSVAVGMGSQIMDMSATDEVLVFVGKDNTKEGLETLFKDLHPADVGYDFNGSFPWKGFEQNLNGEDEDENTLWTKENLVSYEGKLLLRLFKDGTFVESGLDRLPRLGWVEHVDESLPENTIKEAKEKYGDAFRYKASQFYQEGVIKVYGEEIFLIMTENNATIPIERQIRRIGNVNLKNIQNYKPFEFMNDLYEGLIYDLDKTITGFKIDKEVLELSKGGGVQKLTLMSGDNPIHTGVRWEVEDSNIAIVDSMGVVKGQNVGETIVIATYKDTKYKAKVIVK